MSNQNSNGRAPTQNPAQEQARPAATSRPFVDASNLHVYPQNFRQQAFQPQLPLQTFQFQQAPIEQPQSMQVEQQEPSPYPVFTPTFVPQQQPSGRNLETSLGQGRTSGCSFVTQFP